jgi:putative aminopeptidase FrvX
MKKPIRKFLKNYLNNPSPSGFEAKFGSQQIWMDHISQFTTSTYMDAYGTAYAHMGDIHSKYTVVVEAHADEIGWYVNHISSDGYIHVSTIGGSDKLIAPSMRVNLHTKNGSITGIFGHPAIHVQKDHKVDMDSIFIDVGAKDNKEVASLGIEIGTPITFQDGMFELGAKWISGRALDNKIGGFILTDIARKLSNQGFDPDFNLVFVNAVQEEIGLKGAKMASQQLNADIALIIDVTHDTNSPCYNKIKDGDISSGKGTVLSISPAVHNNLLDHVRETLKSSKIKYQLQAGEYTGTDTDVFAYHGKGTPSCLFSIPLKYMHTTVETCHKKDISSTRNAIVETIKNIKNGQNFGY